jgi:hypothetical protein
MMTFFGLALIGLVVVIVVAAVVGTAQGVFGVIKSSAKAFTEGAEQYRREHPKKV